MMNLNYKQGIIFLAILLSGLYAVSDVFQKKQIRTDHPRLFFNADTLPAVISRALNEEKAWYRHYVKNRAVRLLNEKELPSIRDRGDAVGGHYDYGMQAAWSAFTYLVEEDATYLALAQKCIETSLDFYELCYSKQEEVSWRSCSRTHLVMAIDWLWNDLSEADRLEYLARLIRVVNNVKTADPWIDREHMSSYQEGMYGILGLMWPIGIVAYGSGVETQLIDEWINEGWTENMRMIEHRGSYTGDDGGGAAPTLGYVACWYPYAEWNFYYTLLSATGLDILDQIQYNALMPNYVFWNLLPSRTLHGPAEYGYGDSYHMNGNRTSSRDFLYTNMSVIEDLFGQKYPDTATLAKHIKRMLPTNLQRWRNDYFIYPFLLTNDVNSIDSGDINRLPNARNFEKMGQVFMCSGFTPEDVYCLFAAGGALRQHRQFDALSFIIYSNDGFLAIDSGDRYGEVERNAPHIANYYSQSVAHNTILIHQPNEPVTSYFGHKALQMDGGQHNFTGSRLEAFETNTDYTYVAGDGTGCYFHGGDLPEKVSLVTRQMIFLRPNYFVIFDRVNSTRSEYPKTWLLHTINEPQLFDSAFYVDHEKNRLFCQTLLPEKAKLSIVGGSGKEFWSAGRNWPLPLTAAEMKKHETAGRWRVEVRPRNKRNNDYFLHVLQVTDQNVEEMNVSELLQTKDHYGVKIEIGDRCWKLAFNRKGMLGGTISCEGNTNFIKKLTNDIQLQSGIFSSEP
ncbi:MAG: heparinase II/III family protein [Kiritimatiellales bacterium]